MNLKIFNNNSINVVFSSDKLWNRKNCTTALGNCQSVKYQPDLFVYIFTTFKIQTHLVYASNIEASSWNCSPISFSAISQRRR